MRSKMNSNCNAALLHFTLTQCKSGYVNKHQVNISHILFKLFLFTCYID